MVHALLADAPVFADSDRGAGRPSASPGEYKNAVARLAGGVSIIACEADDGPHGRLVGSFTSLSADPPRALVCVGKGSVTHDRLVAATQASIAVLGEDDAEEAQIFSRSERRRERFAEARWTRHPGRPPTYDRAFVSFVATIGDRLDFDSHTMLILHIEQAGHQSGRPAVAFDRKLYGLQNSPII